MGVSETTRVGLVDIPLPKKTRTYTPLAHHDLVNFTQEMTEKLLGSNWSLSKEHYGTARDGKQLFGYHSYENANTVEDTHMTLGFRNSYDKSMSAGFVMGERVLVCSNMMFMGQIKRMRKHTGEAGKAIRHLLYDIIDEAQDKRMDIKREIEDFKACNIEDVDAFALLGRLFGNDILTPRNLPVVKNEWLKPSNDHGEKTLWRFYQACTEALKAASPQTIMQRHTGLHDALNGCKFEKISQFAQS